MKLNDLLLLSACCFNLFSFAQPANNNCANAERLCSNVVLGGTTTGATANAGTDYDFCYTSSSTVWYMFTTNSAGGNVTIDFTNLVFNPDVTMGQQLESMLILATTPCSVPSYFPYSACGTGATDYSITSTVALAANTTYYVQVNGTNLGVGVTQSAQCDFDITISGPAIDKTPPLASISATNTVLCFGDSEIVDATVTNCADTSSFAWYFNNVLLSSGTSNTYDAGTLPGTGYLKLIVSCDLICTVKDTTDSIYFEVTPIDADAGADKFIGAGGQANIDGSGSAGTVSWTPGTTLTNAAIFTPIATPSETTTYFLTVTNGSCTATDSMNVFVGEIITIYSSFTPNGDDINDKWIIRNSDQFDNIEIWIYDRSGQQVFHTTNYSTQDKWWDGTLKETGNPLPASTYFYVIDLKEGDDPIYKGSVTIIR